MTVPNPSQPQQPRLMFYVYVSVLVVLMGSTIALVVVYQQQKQAYQKLTANRAYHLGSAILTTELGVFLNELHITLLINNPELEGLHKRHNLLNLIQKRLDELNQMQSASDELNTSELALERLGEAVGRLQEAFSENKKNDVLAERIAMAQQRVIQLERLHTITHIENPMHVHALLHWRNLIWGVFGVGVITFGGVFFLMRLAYRAEMMRTRSEQKLQESEIRYKTLAFQRRQLLNELDHRVKNTLGGLLSLVDIYQGSSKDVDQFGASLGGKIMAMSTAHEIMSISGQLASGLEGLILRIAEQFISVELQATRLELDCEDIKIESRQVATFAIVCQELFANCAKYGAYSNGEGRVHIQCVAHDPTAKDIGIHLTWRESGGPTVTAPEDMGQGLGMVKGFVQYELGGTCDFGFDASGFCFELKCRLVRPKQESARGSEKEAETQSV